MSDVTLGWGAAPRPTPSPRDPTIGRRIGAYRLVRRVGEGGMGSVYAAERADEEFEQQVAIKLIRPGAVSEDTLRRFRTERQALAALDHPNIARLYDGGTTDDGLPYLIMEFVEGEQIDRYCNLRQLPIPERLQLFRGICSAVQYAHQNLIVHRDLKPNNILVTGDGTPKLLDFGIAKLLNRDSADPLDVTRTEAHPMTPEYASPEQIRGDPITTSTDIYALGVLLYVLLTGRHPFKDKASSIAMLGKAILTEDPEHPSSTVLKSTADFVRGETLERVSRRLRGDLDTIVLTALRKEPERRYPSVERLSDDIGRYLGGLPVTARKDTLRYRTGKFVRRHAVPVAAAAVAIIALVASSVIAMHSAQVAVRERAQAERRFYEVRQLAHFVLFDLDNSIRSGATAARKTVVQEALKYLNQLEKDAGGDPGLEHELVSAYLKVGDLQGNLYSANVGDAGGARGSYESALRIANAVAAAHPEDLAARHDAAAANVKIANLLSFGADRDQALRRYNEAKEVFEKLPPDYPQIQHDLMDVWSKIGFMHLQVGDPRGALAAYEHCLRLATEAAATDRSVEAMRAVAYGNERVGYAMARLGDTTQGLAKLRLALAAYQSLAADSPDKAAAQRDVESTHAVIGDILVESGHATEGIANYRNALATAEALAASDPNNEQYKRDRIVMLSRLADALSKSGRAAESRALTQQALAILQPMIQDPNAADPDLVQYCVLLLSLRDRSRAPEALHYALTLVARTSEKDPVMLDLLARAWFLSGDTSRAIATAGQAMAILNSRGSSDLTKQVERDLAEFRAAPPHGGKP